MSNYWLGVALLSAIAIVIVILPWITKRDRHAQDILSNTQIIKQRMLELEREVNEGLMSEEDKLVAIKELKLALVDEVEGAQGQTKHANLAMVSGFVVTLGICGYLYYHSNEVSDIQHWQDVTQQSSALAKRIVIDADPTITGEDVQDFALAMRTKLLKTPDDHIGWLLLGRLHASLNRLDESIHAFSRAYELAPEHPGVLSSYSQTLVMTGQEDYLRQAQVLMKRSIELNPEDINAFGMLAVTATTLGDNELAIASWQQLQARLPDTDPMKIEIDKRIAALGGEVALVEQTSVMITVNIDESLINKLPENAFLFVFAQDASGAVRMPAAVVKTPLGQLPVQIELSDANAMMTTYKLSQLNEAKLVARISLDENVAPSQGELQGEVVVQLQSGEEIVQQLLINKELM